MSFISKAEDLIFYVLLILLYSILVIMIIAYMIVENIQLYKQLFKREDRSK